MNKIEFKDFAKQCFIDSIKTAKYQADTAARNCTDNGSCNFDACLIRVKKILTVKEFIQMFADCGVNVEKYSSGWVRVSEIHGMAERNTKWHETFKSWLEGDCFECSMHYQLD